MMSLLPWQQRLLDEHDGAMANGNKLPNSAIDVSLSLRNTFRMLESTAEACSLTIRGCVTKVA